MKIQKLYRIALKAMKETDPENKNYCCNNCFVNKLQRELSKTDVNYDNIEYVTVLKRES